MKRAIITMAIVLALVGGAGQAKAASDPNGDPNGPRCGDPNHPYPIGDLNHDCRVNLLDLAILASHWLEDNTPVNSNSIVKDGIEYYIQTDKAVYDLGGDVEMLYRVTNLTDEDVEFLFWYSVEWNFWVNNGGENIWTAVTGWWAYINTLELRPGQAKEYLYTWNMEDSEGTLVAPGQYDVTGGFDARMDEFGDYDFSKVVVTVKIEP